MAGVVREYNMRFRTDRAKGRQIHIGRIPPGFYQRVRRKQKREGVSMRSLVLTFLEQWVNEGPASDNAAGADDAAATPGADR